MEITIIQHIAEDITYGLFLGIFFAIIITVLKVGNIK